MKSNNKETIHVEMESNLTAKELSYLTGLSEEKCEHFMAVNNMNGDEALKVIDIFMQSLNDHVRVPIEVAGCMNNAGIYTEMARRLNAYNTMRGGVKGYCGFVFEEMHAANAATKGVNISVLGDNGIADFIVKDSSGHETFQQAKAGYKPHQIDWSKYEGQSIIVDKGNTVIASEARSAGLQVEESEIFKRQADVVARAQQLESKITGQKSAPIVGTMVSAHNAGLASAKLAARVGVSMKLGENIYDVLCGNKDFEDATADVIVDGAVLMGGAYLGTAAFTAAGTVASTAIADTMAGAAVASTAAAVTNTAVGEAVAGAVAGIAAAPLPLVIAGGVALGFVGKAASEIADADDIGDAIDDMGDAIGDAIDDIGDAVETAVDDIGDAIIDTLDDIEWTVETVAYDIEDAIDGIGDAIDDIGDAVETVVDDIGDAISDFIDIFSIF